MGWRSYRAPMSIRMSARVCVAIALAAVLILLFPDAARRGLHVVAAGWIVFVGVCIPMMWIGARGYWRREKGWPARRLTITRVAIFGVLVLFGTVVMLPEYKVWFALLP